KLSLNSATTHLVISSPFTAGDNESVDTKAGSLTFNGTATLENEAAIESSSGALTFNGNVSLDNSSILLTGGSALFNSAAQISGGELKLYDSSLTLAAGVSMTNSSKLSLKNTSFAGSSKVTLTGGTLELGGTIGNLSSVQTDTNTSLELNSDTTISRTDPMEAGGLNLNTFSLTLGSDTTDLTFNSPIVLNNAASELITQGADLVLQDSLQLTAGKITSTAGTFTFTKGGSSGTNSTLDLSGTKLKLKEDLSVQNGTLTTNNNSILHLLDNLTVTYNGEKTFKALELNGNVLTLGSASTDLKVLDALTLSSNTLKTGDADLTLAVTLNTNSLIDSTGGTLKISGTVDNSSEIAIPGTGLALSDDLTIAGTLTTGANTTINRNNNELDLSGTLIKLGGDLNLAGSVTDNATRLILQTDASLANTSSTGIGSLDLNGYALTTSMGLTINDALTLDASGEKLLTGSSDLTLNDTLVISNGKLTSTSGTISFDSTVGLGAAGTIDIQGGE
ncbi:MAG: hypothetical protein NZ878_00290, partial [SAR324 cluster bacterium]|nr:hypothetical protein [SAR324 cluster bacterium]